MRIARWRLALIIGWLLLAVMMIGCPTPSPPTSVTSFPPTTKIDKTTPEPLPAKFVGSNLIITPTSARTGESVTVTIDVKNIGGIEGNYRAVLSINGVETKINTGALIPGETESSVFTIVEEEAGVYEIEIGGLTGTLTVTSPAKFVGSNLIITPTSARTGQSVTVTIDVKNIGGIEGSYRAVLSINGVETKINTGALMPGEIETTVFTIVKEEAGVYEIEIGGLTGTLTVTSVPVPTYSNPQTYRVVRTITVRNDTARVDSFRVWLPAATDWDSQKNVVSEETIPFPSSVWIDPQYGTGIFFLEINNSLPAGSSLVITDEFVFTSYEVNFDIDPEKVAAYDKTDAQYILYTRSENYLEAGDANIIKTASAIRGNKTNPYEIAHSFYTWVMEHMTYQNILGLNGAKFAYDNGYGNCGDYSCLFVALCRASGIPARPIIGRLATSIYDEWHCWAEFFLPGYGWVPVDATWGDSSGGNYFGHIDNKRLIFNKQCNVVLHPTPRFFTAECAILQTSAWEYQGTIGTITATLSYSIVPISGN